MFDPKYVFSGLWAVQIVLHLVFAEAFDPFEITTWIAILLTIFSFNTGALVTLTAYTNVPISDDHNCKCDSSVVNRFVNFLLFFYMIAFVIACIKVADFLSSVGGVSDLSVIRNVVVADFTSDRDLYGTFKVFYFGVGISIFLTAFAKRLTRKQLVIVLLVGLISAIATTGRLYILLFFCATTVLLYRNRVISPRSVAISGVFFVGLFFLIAVLFAKGDQSGSVLDNVLWNSQVYFMSSVACFNDFVATGAQSIDGGALLPDPIRAVLSFVGADISPKPPLLPFAFVPIQCNTYTVLFPLFHDGGLWGVMVGLFLIGMLHQFLYLKYLGSDRPIWWYFYAISLYPLVMSIFEDAYFSSPGFWMLLWMPPILYLLFIRVNAILEASDLLHPFRTS